MSLDASPNPPRRPAAGDNRDHLQTRSSGPSMTRRLIMSRTQWSISAIVLLVVCFFCLGLLASQARYAPVAHAGGARSRPAGVLLSSTGPGAGGQGTPTPTATATGTPCAPPAVFMGSLDDTDPTFARPFGFDQGGVCQEGPIRHYDAYELQTGPGLVTASLCYGATYDSYLILYQAPGGARIDPFVPNGCENAVTADDDYCGLQSLVSATLSGGYYYIVVSQVLSSTGLYTLTVSSPGMCPLPTVTSTAMPTATGTDTPTPAATQTSAALPTSTRSPSATRTSGPTGTPAATATPCGATFSDVNPGDYFYGPVLYLACHAVISGYADGAFRPYNETTRAQMIKIVVNAFGVPSHQPSNGKTFADVPPTHPFFSYIEAAANGDIINGYACGGPGERCDDQNRPYFRPYANVTRGQLSKIDAIAAGWPQVNPPLQTFADVAPDTAFYTFVETAYCHGVVSGYTCGGPGEPCDSQNRPYFRQFNDATRGQIAKIVYGSILSGAACATP
jgi:hypothetical protein